MFMAATAAFTTIGCGQGDGVTPGEDWALDLHVELQDGAQGQVDVVEPVSGIDATCEDDCTYGVNADQTATLTPVPFGDAVFVGWSGDCTGSGAVDKVAAADETVDCTATFAAAGADDPPREGILVANRYSCTGTPAPGFDCNVAPGTSVNVNAPSAALDAALLTANPSCYYYVDVSDFSSEDHGVVSFSTTQISATATWGGGYYNFTGLGYAPFATPGEPLTITTSGGTVEIDSPPAITLADDPTDGLTIETTGDADTIRLLAFGYDADDNSFGVLCRFPFELSAPVSNPDFASAIALAGGGAYPDQVFAGVSNQAEINGWDEEPRVGEAVRWFQLDGATLEAMGELQQP